MAINKLALYQAIHSGQRIYEIEIAGDTQYVMVKELQYHPVNDDVIHIDLMRVRRSEKIKIAVLCDENKLSDAKKSGAEVIGSEDLLKKL